MKVKVKRWHSVAIWKWGIDEDVSFCFSDNEPNLLCIFMSSCNLFYRIVAFVVMLLKHVHQISSIQVMIVHHYGVHADMLFICNVL